MFHTLELISVKLTHRFLCLNRGYHCLSGAPPPRRPCLRPPSTLHLRSASTRGRRAALRQSRAWLSTTSRCPGGKRRLRSSEWRRWPGSWWVWQLGGAHRHQRYVTMRCNSVRDHMIQYDVIQYGTVQDATGGHNTKQHDTIRH